MIDSHCHLNRLDLTKFDGQIENAINYAQSQGVTHFLTVCVTPDEVPSLKTLADKFPTVSFSVGCHPNDVMQHKLTQSSLITLAEHPACVALGETGLDYYRSETQEAIKIQHEFFRIHLQVAHKIKKPVIIHTREAAADTILIMREENAAAVGGVMHCFTENWDVAKQALDLNFYISFSGIVTFKNAKTIHEVAQKVPLDKILIETDSPFLAPDPHRGQANHPALVKLVAEKIAQLRGITFEEVDNQTTENYYQCFGKRA